MRRHVHPWVRENASEVSRTTPKRIVNAVGIRPSTNHRILAPYKFKKTVFVNSRVKILKALSAGDCVIAIRILEYLKAEPFASRLDITHVVPSQMNKHRNAIPSISVEKAEKNASYYTVPEVERVFHKMVETGILRYTGTHKGRVSRKSGAQKKTK